MKDLESSVTSYMGIAGKFILAYGEKKTSTEKKKKSYNFLPYTLRRLIRLNYNLV